MGRKEVGGRVVKKQSEGEKWKGGMERWDGEVGWRDGMERWDGEVL